MEAEEPEDGPIPHQATQADEQNDATNDDFRDMACKASGPIVSIPRTMISIDGGNTVLQPRTVVLGCRSIFLLAVSCSPRERKGMMKKQ